MELYIGSNIIDFWFTPNNSKKWFCQDKNFDKTIYDTFNKKLEEKRKVILDECKTEDKIYLIENIILFDQISRNIYRINKHEYREFDDFIAIQLSIYYIDKYGIKNIKEEYFYFLILPLRHSRDMNYCKTSVFLIDVYENNNIIKDKNIWLNFKCASYRSLYNSSSQIIINNPQKFKTIEEFKKSIDYFSDIIDENIKNIDKFNNNSNNNKLYCEILNSLKKYSPNFNKSYCISLSGGVDSMCIAHIMSIIGKEYSLEIHAVHLKHSNRDESIKEAEMIKEYCLQLNIKYHQIDIDHIRRNEINRDYYETETRRIRFDFYRNIKSFYNVELFALGHHCGDISENVLTNLIKGRTLLDLPVMKEFDLQEGVTLWRPLLNVSKNEIFEYAFDNGIIFTKNSTPEWSVRGKMRNIIFPNLNNMFNCVEKNLYNAGNESRELYDYIYKNVIEDIFNNIKFGKLGFYFPVDKLRNAGITIWKLTIQKIFHYMKINNLKETILKEIMKLENKIIYCCKEYICYYDNNNLIFLNTLYFNDDVQINIILETESENKKIEKYKNFTIDELINGQVEYELFDIDFSKFSNPCNSKSKSKLSKQMKQRFNKILPIEILNKYVWLSNDFDYYLIDKKSIEGIKTTVKIYYM
jgi:tRNA(Ile)-lysidine synthetase-like protein